MSECKRWAVETEPVLELIKELLKHKDTFPEDGDDQDPYASVGMSAECLTA